MNSSEEAKMSKYTSRQWIILVMLGLANIFEGSHYSIMAPLFPREAEAKGVSPTIYGFIFGVYTFVMCLMSPIFGKMIKRFGLKTMFNAGLLACSLSCITFAFISYVYNTNIFIGISFINRIIGSAGHAAFTCSSFAITAKEFSDNVGSAFGILELCIGLAFIIGPIVSGALYEVGGFVLPFVVIGCILMLFTFFSLCILPKDKDAEGSKDVEQSTSFMSLLRIPSIYVFLFVEFSGGSCRGYLNTGLEVHLRQFQLSPMAIGAMFMIEGGSYSIAAPLWGKLSEIIKNPAAILLVACSLMCTSFLMIGPAPFLPLTPSLPLVITSLAIYGVGLSGVIVLSFEGINLAARDNGIPDNIGTHGLVSGIFVSTMSFGYFIGSSVGGVLLDYFGFSMGTLVPISMLFIALIPPLIYLCYNLKSKTYLVRKEEKHNF